MFFNEIFMEASPYWFFFLFSSKHLVSAEVSQAGKKTLLQRGRFLGQGTGARSGNPLHRGGATREGQSTKSKKTGATFRVLEG
jgi:hypothetical protein